MAGAPNAARCFTLHNGHRALARAMLLLLFAVLPAFLAPAFADPVYPQLSGRVTDEAGLLTPQDKAEIEKDLADLEQTSTDQLAVVTVKSLQGYPIEDYGVGLGRKWGIGQKGKDNGVLLIVAPNDRKVRIEVGRRLEPFMTDTMSSLIIQNAILPKFRRGDFAGGIKDGIRDIKSVLLGDAEEVKRRAAGGRTAQDDPSDMVNLFIFLLIVAFIIWVNYRQSQVVQSGVPGSRRRGGGIVVIPGGSGSWGGGWSSGGDSGGGGWSGGGGDFGGGGASGSW
ncbi:MAG: TPM domain-containing protein [Hyphomicrobium sp.]|nr:TPM domain-containing protein [Hyphomicrobium sp.]